MAKDQTTDKKQRVTLTWESDANQVITFDAAITENHSSNTEVTDHPVESGVDITDHLKRLPDELSLVGVVTDDPLVVDRSVNATPANTGGDSNQRAVSAYAFLRLSKDRGKLVRVFTRLRDYRNMAITSLNVTRDAGSSRSISAEIELREILIAVTEQVEAPTPAVTAAPARRRKRKQGKQNAKAETDANKGKARSALSKGLGDQVTDFLAPGAF